MREAFVEIVLLYLHKNFRSGSKENSVVARLAGKVPWPGTLSTG